METLWWYLLIESLEEEMPVEILLKIPMLDTYLDGGLTHLQLPNDGGIGYIIQTVDRSIPLRFEDIRDVALGTAALGTVALGTIALRKGR